MVMVMDVLLGGPVQLAVTILAVTAAFIYLFPELERLVRRLPPGPIGVPLLGSLPALGTMPHHNLAALAKKHGPLFRLKLGTTTVVVACSSEVARELFKHNDAAISSRPTHAGAKYLAYNAQDLVWAPYGPRWRMLRKVCSMHLFSNKALDDLHTIREAEVARLASTLSNAASTSLQPVNLGEMLTVCTANSLGRIMMGKRVFESSEDVGEFRSMVLELMVLAGIFNIGDFVPFLEPFDLMGVAKKMKNLGSRFDAFFSKILDDHRRRRSSGAEAAAGHLDMLNVLLQVNESADGEEGKITDTEIKALLLDLFTAGTDTSASTVEWIIAELIRHPHILKKVQEELDSVIGRDRLVKDSDISKLTYLQAIVKETFRLHPSTPLSLPRLVSESCKVAGHHIPKGTQLLVNVWAISRDPSVWPNPLEFNPSRFMPGSQFAHIDVKGNDFELIPFGAGRRICAGMAMGLRMVQFMAATLLHGFDWELPSGQMPEKLNMEEAYGITLQRAMPLKVHPRPRLLPDAYRVM